MSDQNVTLSKEERLKGYIVVDKDGQHFNMNDLEEARFKAVEWDQGDPESSPHRVFAVIWREVQS